ncbi:MAG: hypothetical protein HWE27_09505 [Gammaproteobacteria bacterium]|nr:hypothetical protein [Gammaproteobacteria bacterium]
MNKRDELDYSAEEQEILSRYRNSSNEMPSSDIDKVIFAAMHRELDNEQKISTKTETKHSFWNAFKIPVSALGAVVMTFTLAHVMWPMIQPGSEVVPFNQPTADSATTISTTSNSQDSILTQEKARQLRQKQAEKVQMSSKRAEMDESVVFYEAPSEAALALPSAEPINQSVMPANEWAVEIIRLAEEGQFDKMNQELKQFTAAYPDYPIYKQLKPFLQ